MFQWKKIGQIFHPQEVRNRDWLKEFAQAPCVLLFDEFVRVYFSCRPEPDERGQYVSYSGFVDLSKNDLFDIIRISEKPVLELGELGDFDEFGTYPISVIRQDDKIYGYYAGWTRCESVPFNVAIGFGVSDDDGVTFKKIGKGPIISYSPDEPFVISGPKIKRFNDQWVLWYIAGSKWIVVDGRAEPIYKIRMATSKDGIHWKKQNKNIIENRIEEDEAQASPDVIYRNGKYHMFFCYRHSRHYRGKEGGYRIGYASSENMIDWSRDDSKVGIDISDQGWDSEMVAYPHVFELDGKIYMFYLGNQVGRDGFGMAELEGDLS